MLKTSMEWRKAHKVDTILDDMQARFEDVGDLKQFFGHGYHGIDRQGNPIWLERGGLFEGD
jgi:hypothetical protein